MSAVQPEQVGWAKVELMGHRVVYGHVREVTFAGAHFIRIDVPGPNHPEHSPSADGPFQFTTFYSPSAVYGMSPIAADLCVRLAKHRSTPPVERYELPPDVPARVHALPRHLEGDDVIDADWTPDHGRWEDDGGTPAERY